MECPIATIKREKKRENFKLKIGHQGALSAFMHKVGATEKEHQGEK